MSLIQAVNPACVVAGLKAESKQDILNQLATLAVKAEALSGLSGQEVLEGLQQREQLGSTGFGDGVAIPHCRLGGAQDFVVGLVSVPEGVDFDAIDGKPVKLLVLMIAPQRESDEHIRMLSSISQVLTIPGAIDEMLAQTSAEGLTECFLRHVRDEQPESEPDTGRSLVTVIIQDEALFEDMLQALGGLETSSLAVLSGENTAVYLSRIPLFADVWRDEPNRFNRIIVAAVPKQLTNETIRRLERVTGPPAERSDVLILVQDVFYAAGSIGR